MGFGEVAASGVTGAIADALKWMNDFQPILIASVAFGFVVLAVDLFLSRRSK